MQTYTGTKTLDAKPMSLGGYNKYQGWPIPLDQDPDDEGYLVEYHDGGKANHPDHKGYISWSPKDVFERTYSKVIELYQQRVVDEKFDLDAKIKALVNFMDGDTFGSVDPSERGRMSNQCSAMEVYSEMLDSRIRNF